MQRSNGMLKEILYKGFAYGLSPVRGLIAPKASQAISIFALHGAYSTNTAAMRCVSSKSVDELRLGFTALKKRFQIISLDDAVAQLKNGAPLSGNQIVLTFDDSIKSLYQLTLPLLKELNLPATFFVSTNAIDAQQYYWWHRLEYAVEHCKAKNIEVIANDIRSGEIQRFIIPAQAPHDAIKPLKLALKWTDPDTRKQIIDKIEMDAGVKLVPGLYPCAELMSWDDVRNIHAQGFSIGSHTVNHDNMSLIPEAMAIDEIKNSKTIIEQQLQAPCQHFCYPFGIAERDHSAVLAEAGYQSAIGLNNIGWNTLDTNAFQLTRFSFHRDAWKAPYQASGQDLCVTRLTNFRTFP